ncbi:MAG: GNAT family N-acetyltransferase [Myxococcales bacterium]|nr:GNAT family N-acetyltransferase [Myxococcales bacterium]
MHGSLHLVPFQLDAATAVSRWARESGRFAPWSEVVSDAVFERGMADASISLHLLLEDGVAVAYGELWRETDPAEVELARILVDPARRRRGLASALIRELVAEALRGGTVPIWVRVLPDNTAALACYSKLGFMGASLDEERRYNEEGQSPGMRWLKLASPDAGP